MKKREYRSPVTLAYLLYYIINDILKLNKTTEINLTVSSVVLY